jgi:hypothetical protein
MALPVGTELEPLSYRADGYPWGQWIEVRVLTSGRVGWVNYAEELVDCNVNLGTLPPGTAPPTPTFTPTPTPTPALPDLVVDSVSIDRNEIVYAEQPWTWIHYRVTNAGKASTPEGRIYLRAWKNGSPSSGYMVVDGPIPPGGHVASKFAVGHDSGWPVGAYSVRVEVDYRNEIVEGDETNNLSALITFQVIQPTGSLAADNLLLNSEAQSSASWNAYGDARVERDVCTTPCFVVRNKGHFFQDVQLTQSKGYVLMIGCVSSERINASGSITGLPYLYGYMIGADGKIATYLQGQQMRCSAKQVNEWVTAWGVFEITPTARTIRFFLMQAEASGVPQNGSAARFDNLGLYVFDTTSAAQEFAGTYQRTCSSLNR